MKNTILADSLRNSEQELAKWRFEALRSRGIIINREHLLAENNIHFNNIEFQISQTDKLIEATPNIHVDISSTKIKLNRSNQSDDEIKNKHDSIKEMFNDSIDNLKESCITGNSFSTLKNQFGSYKEIDLALSNHENKTSHTIPMSDISNLKSAHVTKMELKSALLKSKSDVEKSVHFNEKPIKQLNNTLQNDNSNKPLNVAQKECQQKNKDVVVTIRTIKSKPSVTSTTLPIN